MSRPRYSAGLCTPGSGTPGEARLGDTVTGVTRMEVKADPTEGSTRGVVQAVEKGH